MKELEVTQGMNGYPQGIYNVLTADTISELKKHQEEHGGELIIIKRRDGWQLWQNTGSLHRDSLLDMPAGNSDTVIRYRGGNPSEIAHDFVIGNYESVTKALADHPDASISEAIEILQAWQNRITEIEEAITEGEPIDIWMSNPNWDYINFTVNAEEVAYSDDVWTYRVALTIPEEEED